MLSLRALERYDRTLATPLLCHDIPQSGLYIEDNRTRVVEKFMQTDADWLLQIDSDIQFPPQLIEMMLGVAGDEKKVLAASVPLGPPLPSCGLMRKSPDLPGIWAYLDPHEITEEGVQCDALASAVMLVHRDVFQAIADREGQSWFHRIRVPRLDQPKSKAAWLEDGPISDRAYVNQGEDLSFCLRAVEAGFSIWVAKVPGIRHYKSLPLSHDYETEDNTAAEPVEAIK